MTATIDEITAGLNAIIDGADGRSLTDDEVTRYEGLEAQLATVQRDQQIRARNTAYNTPVNPGLAVPTGSSQPDDTLDRAFTAYLRTGMPNADISALRVDGISNAQSTTGTAGGFSVPPGFLQRLVEIRKAFGGFGAQAENMTTDTGAPLQFPSLDDTANSAAIAPEGAAPGSGGADMVFGQVNLSAFRYTASGTGNTPLKVSAELAQDSAFDITGLVARILGTRLARAEAPHWVTGTGTGQPKGVLAASLTADSTITGATISYSQLVDVESALDPEYQGQAQWLMNTAMWALLKKVVDTAGRPLLTEQAASGAGGAIQRFVLGYPVILDPAAPSNTINTLFMALGSFREAYVIRRVSNPVVVVNPYSSAASGQIEYTAWERADGQIQARKAYAILGRGAT